MKTTLRYLMTFITITLWKFLALVHLFLALIIRLLPRVKKFLGVVYNQRTDFELKNFNEDACKSFYISNKVAEVCFHVSSEGEFEQVRWPIEHMLHENKNVEIIFTSPSVETKIKKLYDSFQNNLRYLRLPIVTLSTKDLSHWITAVHVVMVRYDFFPMLLAMVPEKKISLVWFFRTRVNNSFIQNIKWQLILPLFTYVVASNADDWWWLRSRISYQALWQNPLDFRALSISSRLEKSQSHLQNCFGHYFINNVVPFIKSFKTTILHGNCYPNELNYLLDPNWIKAITEGNVLLAILEHNNRSIDLERLRLNYHIPFYEIKVQVAQNDLIKIFDNFKNNPGILVFTGRGFLVELYSLFRVALVGGGFEGFTHSLLEPYLAGCQVYCGPHVSRSSEYFQIKDWNSERLISIPTLEQWSRLILPKLLEEKKVSIQSNEFTDSKKLILQGQAMSFFNKLKG